MNLQKLLTMQPDNHPKIYIAGHMGLVGSALHRQLTELGFDNFVLRTEHELDLRNQNVVERFFADEKPEYVFLAAAKVGGIIANNTYRGEFIYDNIMISFNVINAAYKYGVKKLLNLGSSCIYPKLAKQPLNENALLTGELEPTNEPYAIAKISAIKLCSAYNYQYGTNFISVMPTNLYGNNDNFNLETSHVMPALIRKMFLAKALSENNIDFLKRDLKKHRLGFGLDSKGDTNTIDTYRAILGNIGVTGESVSIWGTGNVKREFLHVSDMAKACIYLMQNYTSKETGEFVNIGTGTDVTIKELAEIIKNLVGFGGKLVFDNTKPDGTPQKLLDVSKISSLGWKAEISLEKGIELVVADYMNKA